VADEHSDSVRFLTFGDHLLTELLGAVALPSRTVGGLFRAETVDSPRLNVAWYQGSADGVARVESLDDLRSALAAGGTSQASGSQAEAEEDFARALLDGLEAERAHSVARVNERLSALQERGRDLLARATYVWVAAREESGAALGGISDTTVRYMVMTEGYPFGALSAKVGEPGEVSRETRGWAEVESKNAKQLEGLWHAVKSDADRLVRQIVEAEGALEAAQVPAPAPSIGTVIV
jgi:hypothetical protein